MPGSRSGCEKKREIKGEKLFSIQLIEQFNYAENNWNWFKYVNCVVIAIAIRFHCIHGGVVFAEDCATQFFFPSFRLTLFLLFSFCLSFERRKLPIFWHLMLLRNADNRSNHWKELRKTRKSRNHATKLSSVPCRTQSNGTRWCAVSQVSSE